MFAMRSSVTWILPVAITEPSIFVGWTISTSIPESCPLRESLGWVVTETFVVSVPDREQPAARPETRTVRERKSRIVFRLNIQVPCCLEQRRSGRQFQIEKRHLIIEYRLVEAGQCIPSCADRVKQLKCRAFTDLKGIFRRRLNIIDLCQDACPIEFDAALLNIEGNNGFIDVADDLVCNQL